MLQSTIREPPEVWEMVTRMLIAVRVHPFGCNALHARLQADLSGGGAPAVVQCQVLDRTATILHLLCKISYFFTP